MFLVRKFPQFISFVATFFVEPFFVRRYFETSLFCCFDFQTAFCGCNKNIFYCIKVHVNISRDVVFIKSWIIL